MKLKVLFFLLFFTAAMFPAVTVGWYGSVAFRADGKPAGGATIQVCTETDGVTCNTLATLYQSQAGTTTVSQPLTADPLGNYKIFAPPGFYDVKVTYGASTYIYLIQVASPSGILGTPNTWTAAQIGPFYTTGPVIDVGAFGTNVCSGSDDTTAINAAMAAAGSLHSPATMTYLGATHNTRQGEVRFPSSKKCIISSTIQVPPGVFVDLNNSMVTQTGSGDAFDFAYDYLGGYGYGYFWGGMRNGFLQGPGSNVSTGRGIFLNVASFGYFENIQIQGFKFGVTGWEVQYSKLSHIYATNNKVGIYFTARPTATTLTSIDNTFEDIVADLNDFYGIWCQECDDSAVFRMDASRNLIADIVIGSQLNNYLKTFTVTSGGSGYALNAKIPVTITDPNGHYAQAFATTNGSGVVISVTAVDAGQGYTNPSVTVPGGSVAAGVTANVFTDLGLGDWDGVANINRGHLLFEQVKSEHCIGTDGPFSGYAMLINDVTNGAPRDIEVHNFVFSRQTNANTGGCPVVANSTGYARMVFNAGFGNSFFFSGFSGYDGITNPAQGGFTDVSVFRNIFSQGLTLRFPTFSSNSDDVMKYTVDENGALAYGGFRQATVGFTGDGMTLAPGYVAKSTFSGANAFKGAIAGEAQPRFWCEIGGTCHWGPGGSTVTDTNLYRETVNQLKTDGNIHALGILTGDSQVRSPAFYGGANSGHAVDFYTYLDGGQFEMTTTSLVPFTDLTKSLGDATHRFTAVYGSTHTGTGTATFAAGVAAGTSPGTPTCTTSHVCDSFSGTVSFTMGTATTTGIALTVTTSTTRTNQANCVGAMYLVASPFTAIPIRLTETTTTVVFNVGTAPTASTAYELTYICGSN